MGTSLPFWNCAHLMFTAKLTSFVTCVFSPPLTLYKFFVFQLFLYLFVHYTVLHDIASHANCNIALTHANTDCNESHHCATTRHTKLQHTTTTTQSSVHSSFPSQSSPPTLMTSSYTHTSTPPRLYFLPSHRQEGSQSTNQAFP